MGNWEYSAQTRRPKQLPLSRHLSTATHAYYLSQATLTYYLSQACMLPAQRPMSVMQRWKAV